jgi:FAD/FMN-containing dehydrogenase
MVNWEPLDRSMDGELALPGSPTYETSTRSFNARFHAVRPSAVASCATAEDASEAIRFARSNGLEIAVRSGGHSFAGHSSTRGLLADVSRMRSVSVSADVATVGAGARLGDVYEALDGEGLAIPAGTCPSVGVAGLTLGGGLGILGRMYGVTSDRLVAAEIVLGDGRVLTCDADRHGDLFWALRGGGAGAFGIVTSLRFRTVPAPEATNVHLSWPFANAAATIDASQAWAPEAPDELAASLKVTATDDRHHPPSVDVYAAALGTRADVTDLFDELVARIGSDPETATYEHLSFAGTRRFWADFGAEETVRRATDTIEEPVVLFSKSEFFRRPLPAEAIETLVEAFGSDRAAGSRELDFIPWGGAYNRVPADASAFVHREERFQLKHTIVVEPIPMPGRGRRRTGG